MAVYTDFPKASSRPSCRTIRSASCSPTRASPKARRTPTSCCTPPSGSYILTLYEKRVDTDDLPFFLGLMQHLAGKGISCPLPVQRARRRADRHARRPPGGAHHLPRRHVDAPADRRRIAARSARRWPDCISPARIFRCRGRMRWRSTAGASSGQARASAPTRSSRALRPRSTPISPCSTRNWPKDLPAGVIHADLFPGQRLLPRREAVRADRLLFRLQRSSTPMTSRPASTPGASRRTFPST